MHTDVHCYRQCNNGSEANVVYSAVRISSLCSCLCLTSTQQFNLFLVRAITYNRPGGADA